MTFVKGKNMLKTRLMMTLGLAAALTACGGQNTKKDEMVDVQLNNDDFYEVHAEGRIYLFDDLATYQSFNEVGETSYRKVYIGEGPKGETLVFGLTGEDKKKTAGIASIDMYHGELAAAENFYGEMQVEGRIYVFDSYKEMETVRKTGEAAYRFTDIGSGPNGETVVYVLQSAKKKQKPVDMIAAFKAHNMKM